MLIALTVAFVLIIVLFLTLKRRTLKRSDLAKRWQNGFKDGWSFEQFMTDLFNNLGYRAVVTKGSHDFGVDIIVKNSKCTYVFQAKYYSNSISPKALEEALMAAALYGVDRIGIVTNAEIPQAVKDFAEQICKKTFVKKVLLIGRPEIERMLRGEKLI
ncbi:MAG TPA: restriction endonuclease [Pseudothermotoga sp.]|nr:restriction endonuclease [Pseudothermotoga sp.]HOK83085.1 restriction endonuclease [Pseudothermotoga sp.]HPP69744.1 restriction endonuclease [Pseudothermotoga sp.]